MGRCPCASRVLLIRRSNADAQPIWPRSSRIERTTELALATTAGARDSASAIREIMQAPIRSPQFSCRIRSRCFFGGTGSSNTMSKRRINAGSSPSIELDNQSVGTGFSSSIRLIHALRTWAVLLRPKKLSPSSKTSSTSSKAMSAWRCAKKLWAARNARRRRSPFTGSPSASSLATSNSSHPSSSARARAS